MGHLHIKSLFLVQQTVSKFIDLCELGLSNRRKEGKEKRKGRKEGRIVKASLEAKARCYIVPAYELGYFLIHMTETHFTLLK